MPSDLIFYDLSRLLPLRQTLRDLDPTRPPDARLLHFPGDTPRRLALLSGSFNPPTDAHLALAEAARAAGQVDAVGYLLASRTVNKERVEGASLADRLLLLEEIARPRPREGVVLVNRGLFVDQALLIRDRYPQIRELWFIVGFDKIVQIFDPRYYVDLKAALDTLFDLASFFVSPRAEAGPAELQQLLDAPDNRRYAHRVHYLDLAPTYRDDSSTRARRQLAAGDEASDVPAIVHRFVAATSAYRPPLRAADGQVIDRYQWRERAIGLSDSGQLPRLTPDELADLVTRLTDPGPAGAALRELADQGNGDKLARIIRPEKYR